jgi:mannose-6-phosphate isomerase-like protein (cupin superfamily)
VGARIGEEELRLNPGAVAFMPRGIPHAQWNDGPEPARVLEIYTPGGFERVFEEAGRMGTLGIANGR